MSLDLFGKPLELLTEEEMFELEEKIEDQFGKRNAPSIKMAELDDDSAMYEYKKYVFEMREQGLEPVSFRQFLDQILSEARG
jgi:ADP-ribosylglycohydrolase